MNRRRFAEEEVRQDRWLVSYADLVTLLLALFVVLFASAYHDRASVERVSSSVKAGFDQMAAVSPSDGSLGKSASNQAVTSAEASRIPSGSGQGAPATVRPRVDAGELKRQLQKDFGQEIERHEVVLRETPEGFVISLRELGFFNSGEARLLPGAAGKIKRIATLLMLYDLYMRVEGHSDSVPIHNASFNSNWELSTARALSVANMLMDDSKFDPKRMSIAGYGPYQPTASNDTPEGRQANRRVDIVVLSIGRPAVKAAR